MHVELHLIKSRDSQRGPGAAAAEGAALRDLLGSRLELKDPGKGGSADAVRWYHGVAGDSEPESLEASRSELRAHLEAGGAALLSGTGVSLWPDLQALELADDDAAESALDAAEPLGLIGLPGSSPFHRVPGGVLLQAGAADAAALRTAGRVRWPSARPGRVLGVLRHGDSCIADRAGLIEYPVGDAGRLLVCTLPIRFADGDLRYAERRAAFFGDLFDHLVTADLASGGVAWPEPDAVRDMHVRAVSGNRVPMVAIPAELPEGLTTRLLEDQAGGHVPVQSPDGQSVLASAERGALDLSSNGVLALRDLGWQWNADEAAAARCTVFESAAGAAEGIDWADERAGTRVALRAADDGQGFCLVFRVEPGETDGGEEEPRMVTLRGTFELGIPAPYPRTLAGATQVLTARHGSVLVARSEHFELAASVAADRRPQAASVRELDGGVAFERRFEVKAGDDLVVSLDSRGAFGAMPMLSTGGQTEPADGPAEGSADPVPDRGTSLGLRIVPRRAALDLLAGVGDEQTDPGRALNEQLARQDRQLRTLPTAWPSLPGQTVSRAGFGGAPGAEFHLEHAVAVHPLWLAQGQRAVVAGDLRLAARSMDAEGWIGARVSASGFAARGGPDTNAAFLTGLAQWLAWTGDDSLVAELWPVAERACGALRRFDLDGDGLCEGAEATLGDPDGGSGIRIPIERVVHEQRAWLAAAELAEALCQADAEPYPKADLEARAAEARARAEGLRELVAECSWLGDEARHASAIEVRAGSAPEPLSAEPVTAAAALPWLHGLGEPGSESAALRRHATAQLQADRGSRLTPGGPVSAEATGWTTLADFMHGRPESAWSRWSGFRAASAADTGLAGLHTSLGGVLHGLLGVRRASEDSRIIWEPTLPGSLESVAGTVRIAGFELDLRAALPAPYEELQLDVTCRAADDLATEVFDLECAPFLGAPLDAEQAVVEYPDDSGRDAEVIDSHLEDCGDGVRLRTRLRLEAGTSLRLRWRARPDLLVEFPDARDSLAAEPMEDGQTGPRWLGRRVGSGDVDGGVESVQLELELSEPMRLPVRFPGRPLLGVEGADLLEVEDGAPTARGESATLSVQPGPGSGPRRASVGLRFAARSE